MQILRYSTGVWYVLASSKKKSTQVGIGTIFFYWGNGIVKKKKKNLEQK